MAKRADGRMRTIALQLTICAGFYGVIRGIDEIVSPATDHQ
jgi:hypothetical protein